VKPLLDHNLSFRLLLALASLYPGSVHVSELGMTTASDDVIWNQPSRRL